MRRAAFEAAVAEHGGRVFTLAVYLLRNREEAEEVAQDVLLRLWRRGDEVEAAKIGAWLVQVTRNRCIDLMRSRPGRRWVSEHDAAAWIDNAADGRPGPESRARSSELGSKIRDALAGLSEPYRSVVVLREIQGLSYGEIGDVLEIPLNTVRVTLHRARKKLRDALREEYDHVAVC